MGLTPRQSFALQNFDAPLGKGVTPPNQTNNLIGGVIKQGDIIVLELDPTKGHEQAGYRPALVVNNVMHSKNSRMILICPITNTDRKSIMHVKLTETATTGFVLCDQIRAVDLSSRKFKTVEALDHDTLWDVCDIIKGAVDIL